MKKVLALVLATAMVLSLAACGASPAQVESAAAEVAQAVSEAAKEEAAPAAEAKEEAPAAEAAAPAAEGGYTFVYTCATTDNEYFANVAQGCQQFCDENGIAFSFEGAEYDAAKQYEQFENYIAKGVNAIIACPVDQASLADVIEKAHAQGIVVIGQAQAIDGADGNSVVDDYEYGVHLGDAACQWIEKYMPDEEVEVALLTLDHQDQVKLRGDGMEETINALGHAKVVFRQKAESSEEGMTVIETALTANPGIKVIACVNDQMAIGAWQAVDAAGVSDDKFYIGGGDYTSAIVDYLEDPACAIRCSVDILPVQSGIDCAEMAYKILEGTGKGETKYFTFDPKFQPGTM